MASGFQGRIALAQETTYGTRAAPARFFPFTAEDLGFTVNRAAHDPLGGGMWQRVSVITTKIGEGSLTGDITTTGFGYLLDKLHGETVAPVQQGVTAAYMQTHTLSSPPSKSLTVQVQTPPVSSQTLIPHEMLGVMLGGATFSWDPDSLLSFEFPALYRDLDTTQSNIAYVAPPAYSVFSYLNGSIRVGGALEAAVIGGGSVTLDYPLRQQPGFDGTGLIRKPVLEGKSSVSGSFTVDFEDNTQLNRALNGTIADVVLTFEGANIASTYNYMFRVTIPGCVFTTGRPTISTQGPLTQEVTFENSSSTGANVVIEYQSTDATL